MARSQLDQPAGAPDGHGMPAIQYWRIARRKDRSKVEREKSVSWKEKVWVVWVEVWKRCDWMASARFQ